MISDNITGSESWLILITINGIFYWFHYLYRFIWSLRLVEIKLFWSLPIAEYLRKVRYFNWINQKGWFSPLMTRRDREYQSVRVFDTNLVWDARWGEACSVFPWWWCSQPCLPACTPDPARPLVSDGKPSSGKIKAGKYTSLGSQAEYGHHNSPAEKKWK